MKNVLVVGDVMCDEYVYVETTRRAAEARIPIWDVAQTEWRLGGAGNTAHNLKKMAPNTDIFLVGLFDDELADLIRNTGMAAITHGFYETSENLKKTRYVLPDGTFGARVDSFKKFDPNEARDLADYVDRLSKSWPIFDAVVVSDYDKGTVTEQLLDVLRPRARFIVVDSKREDLRLFSGSKLLKLNELEYSVQVSSKLYPNFTSLFDYCVVTKGKAGADLLQCDRVKSNDRKYVIHRESFSATTAHARDVTGAGDTHTAAMVSYLLEDESDVRNAVRYANIKAAEVIQKFGTSVPMSS